MKLGSRLAGLLLLLAAAMPAAAADLKGGTLRVAILADINDFDPQSFLGFNFPLIKNFYDSLIEHTRRTAKPSPAWRVPGPSRRTTAPSRMTLRSDGKFASPARR